MAAMSELEIVQREVGLLSNFCEVIGCPETREAALVDPAFEVDRLLAVARDRGWRVTTLLLTHAHADHINGLGEAARATGAVVRCHPAEVDAARAEAPRVEPVADGERFHVGAGVVEAIHAPGHTPGCVCWWLPESSALVTGDVLFVGSCGSVSLPGSDPAAMFATLQRLALLPEESKIYPGHDYGPTPTSTLAWELLHNPALLAQDLAAFCRYKQVRVPT